ncbi:MAG: hypothetical protein N4A50_08805 [Vallitalea sp.]|jgi:outer membrane murein-binding lipoprotein Lpp|nr:hypothetical protein [Vallitalea sp.]
MKKLFSIILIVVLFTGCSNELNSKYNELNSEYAKLELKNISLEESLSSLKSEFEQQKLSEFKKSTSDIVFIWNGVPFGRSWKYFDEWLNQLNLQYDNFNNVFNPKMLTEEEQKELEAFNNIFNKEYYAYDYNNKFMGKTNATLSIGEYDGYEGVEAKMVYDNTTLDGIFVSGKYNHIPRDINRILDTTSSDIEKHIIPDNPNLLDRYMELGKHIVPNNMETVITKIIECDLDGDNELEKIVRYSNAPEESDYLSENWFELNFSKYYTIIVILDTNYELIDYIHNIRNINDNMAYTNLYTDIEYILDVDNDEEMEIISIKPGWEGVTIFVDNLIKHDRRIEGDTYYH